MRFEESNSPACPDACPDAVHRGKGIGARESLPPAESAAASRTSDARGSTRANAADFDSSSSDGCPILRSAKGGDFDSSDESALAVTSEDPEWRRILAAKLAAYRARHGRAAPDTQVSLPFSSEARASDSASAQPDRTASRASARSRPPSRTAPQEPVRLEINVSQPALDFAGERERQHPQSALVPVATIRERRFAGLLDLCILAGVLAAFLGAFRAGGGELAFDRVDAAVYALTFFLLYVIYFSMFTYFGGPTPGMMLRNISVVRMDGTLADSHELSWRSFGYFLSGVTLLLGFLWSLWDEDLLTWHDRISRTYLTSASPAPDSSAAEPISSRRPGAYSSAHTSPRHI
ncbi:MAG: RDD family protein [Candidatus Acidiferrales bacterium]